MDIMESQQIAISIHTSTREVTARDRGRFGAVIYFNPHFHKGSDLTIYAQHDFKLISIHTSTREVTSINMPKRLETNIFQSTLPQGK